MRLLVREFIPDSEPNLSHVSFWELWLTMSGYRAIFVWLLTTEKSGQECVPEEIASIVIDDMNSLVYSKALHLLYT